MGESGRPRPSFGRRFQPPFVRIQSALLDWIRPETASRAASAAALAAATALGGCAAETGGGTPGIFIAAGPGFDRSSELGMIDLHDITPTLLCLLGLPVAEDFDGVARVELFEADFLEANPLRTISTWGTGSDALPIATEADAKLREELRALGYLD